MNKKQKREAGRIKAEEALAENQASGLEAQREDQKRREEQEKRIDEKIRKINAEYETRLEQAFENILKEGES